MNNETCQPTVPGVLDTRSRWSARDDAHYRALVLAGTETLAVLTSAPGGEK